MRKLHAVLGARFGEFAGWEMPLWYGGAVEEVKAVRASSGVFDISHMGRFAVTGERAASALSRVFSRDFSRLAVERSTYALACNEDGGILDDLMVYRPSDWRFVVVCNAANRQVIGRVLDGIRSEAEVDDLQAETNLLAVQGPEAPGISARHLVPSILELPSRGCREVDLWGTSCLVARTGYTGEDGFEIMIADHKAEILLQALIENGVKPCGLASRDTLRLEASLPLYGLDMDESTTPWEVGLGWALNLRHDFTGSEALKRLKGAEERRLTCLVADAPGVIRSHQPLMQGEQEVAHTSSGGYSPTLDRSIAMAFLPIELGEPGTQLDVDARGRRIACHVIERPFYRSASRA